MPGEAPLDEVDTRTAILEELCVLFYLLRRMPRNTAHPVCRTASTKPDAPCIGPVRSRPRAASDGVTNVQDERQDVT